MSLADECCLLYVAADCVRCFASQKKTVPLDTFDTATLSKALIRLITEQQPKKAYVALSGALVPSMTIPLVLNWRLLAQDILPLARTLFEERYPQLMPHALLKIAVTVSQEPLLCVAYSSTLTQALQALSHLLAKKMACVLPAWAYCVQTVPAHRHIMIVVEDKWFNIVVLDHGRPLCVFDESWDTSWEEALVVALHRLFLREPHLQTLPIQSIQTYLNTSSGFFTLHDQLIPVSCIPTSRKSLTWIQAHNIAWMTKPHQAEYIAWSTLFLAGLCLMGSLFFFAHQLLTSSPPTQLPHMESSTTKRDESIKAFTPFVPKLNTPVARLFQAIIPKNIPVRLNDVIFKQEGEMHIGGEARTLDDMFHYLHALQEKKIVSDVHILTYHFIPQGTHSWPVAKTVAFEMTVVWPSAQ